MDDLENKKLNTLALKKFLANFLIPIVSLSITAALFAFWIYPSFAKVPTLEKDLEDKQQLGVQLQQKLTKLNSLLDFKSVVEEYNVLVSDVLASDSLVPQLLTQIDLIAGESGIAITQLSYSTGDRGELGQDIGYNIVSVNLGVSGTFDQLLTFLANLENAGRIVVVNTIRYSLSENEDSVAASLVLISPYVQVNTTAATDDPISFDLANDDFQSVVGQLKNLKIYRISVEDVIDVEAVPQTTPSEEQTP